MATLAAIVGWVALGIAIIAGLLLDVVGLFGNWIILGAMAITWAVTGFEHFGPWGMGAMLALAVFGEVIEMIAAGLGASKFGGSRGAGIAAMLGCIGGAIVGTPVFPVIGTLAGACVGAFVAAAVFEIAFMRREVNGAVRTGVGAALGKIAGLLAKMLVGFLILFVAAFTY